MDAEEFLKKHGITNIIVNDYDLPQYRKTISDLLTEYAESGLKEDRANETETGSGQRDIPTDREILKAANEQTKAGMFAYNGFVAGAKWLRSRMKGGDND